jgi:pyrimidine-nucleoside phosphorylase
MNLLDLIYKKREGQELSSEEISMWVESLNSKTPPPDYQLASLLAFVFAKGMSDREISDLTLSMKDSGKTLDYKKFPKELVVMDKHSTGGVGDKISLPLAPLVIATCERALIPMVAGRGLGHTGGTVDKLESIPGFRIPKDSSEFYRWLKKNRMVFAGQTKDIAPADRVMYAMRDVTGTVPSIPLITASILSKKLAENLKYLLLDVKFGSGAFMIRYEDALQLAQSLQRVCRLQNVESSVFLTNMGSPLGEWMGHRAEVFESMEILKDAGPADSKALTLEFARSMCLAGGVFVEDLEPALEKSLSTGAAFDCWKQVIETQGGSLSKFEKLYPAKTLKRKTLTAKAEGFLSWDVRELGLALLELGGGRKQLKDKIDFDVALRRLASSGAKVEKGQALLEVYHRSRGLEACVARIHRAARISQSGEILPLIRQRL